MRLHRHAPLMITLCLALTYIAPQTQAQSDSQLRRQNDELRERVRELTEELRQANQQIAELQKTIAQLERDLDAARSGRGEVPPLEEKVSIDESTPDASPRALLSHLQEDYQATLGEMETGSTGDRERNAYMRALERWTKRVNRELRMPIEWHVKVVDAVRASRGVRLELIAIDPEHGTELGDSFIGTLNSSSVIRRLERFDENGQMDHLVLRGVLEPKVSINPGRDAPGTFNTPPFIGPFAEFAMTVTIETMLPPEEAAKEKRDREKSGR